MVCTCLCDLGSGHCLWRCQHSCLHYCNSCLFGFISLLDGNKVISIPAWLCIGSLLTLQPRLALYFPLFPLINHSVFSVFQHFSALEILYLCVTWSGTPFLPFLTLYLDSSLNSVSPEQSSWLSGSHHMLCYTNFKTVALAYVPLAVNIHLSNDSNSLFPQWEDPNFFPNTNQ